MQILTHPDALLTSYTMKERESRSDSIIEEENMEIEGNPFLRKTILNLGGVSRIPESKQSQQQPEDLVNKFGPINSISKKILFHDLSESEDPSPGISSNRSTRSMASLM